MGIASSVNMAYSDEDPSANQGEFLREEEESRTVIEELNETKEEEEEEEEEEEGECPLCSFIKGGECKESFISLEKCIDEAVNNGEESDVTKCKEVRMVFKNCMYENPLYYEPILAAEAQVIAKMLSELHAEKQAILAGEAAAIATALSKLKTEEVPILPAEAAAIGKAFSELEAGKEERAEESNGNEAPSA